MSRLGWLAMRALHFLCSGCTNRYCPCLRDWWPE